MPSSPYSTDIDSRIAPRLYVPRKTAAVSGSDGSSVATRSPRSTPTASSTFANRLDSSWSSPKLTRRSFPSQSSQTIASRSGSCLSHTSWAML